MERRKLGADGPEITVVGIGTAPIGSGRDWVYWGGLLCWAPLASGFLVDGFSPETVGARAAGRDGGDHRRPQRARGEAAGARR